MQNPCYGCVSPKRYPGCHDCCPERKEYVETDLNKKHQYQEQCRLSNYFDNEMYTYNLRYNARHQRRF